MKKLLDTLKDAFEALAKALKARKRKVVEFKKSADGSKKIETTWKSAAAKEAAARKRALELDAKNGGHVTSRHGPELSDADLKKRLETGVTPDGKFSPTPASTKFSSNEELVKTQEDALAKISKQNNVDLTKPPQGPIDEYTLKMDHGRPIDEGFVGDKATKVKVTDPNNPSKTGWGYPNSTPVDGITGTTTRVRWDAAAGEWKVKQHYPDAQGWNQATQSYTP